MPPDKVCSQLHKTFYRALSPAELSLDPKDFCRPVWCLTVGWKLALSALLCCSQAAPWLLSGSMACSTCSVTGRGAGGLCAHHLLLRGPLRPAWLLAPAPSPGPNARGTACHALGLCVAAWACGIFWQLGALRSLPASFLLVPPSSNTVGWGRLNLVSC